MNETILWASPNWYLVSGLAVSKDGWLVYGGPSKSLCILEPLEAQRAGIVQGSQKYQAHVFNRAHLEKIVSVDIFPEWPEKRLILTGSVDGSVKQWDINQLLQNRKVKPTHSHEAHSQEKEEIAGAAYSTATCAITAGSFGNVVKWDLNSNVVKSYSHLKSFKPVCLSCSPHIPLNVALGTKQGVVFVLDLNGEGKIIYKVRSQDDEIVNISWCPQYEVTLKKTLSESEMRGAITNITKAKEEVTLNTEKPLNTSGVVKNLPDDSFDESLVVAEDDMFDIYKDHEADEFGHKKYQPEDIVVKVSQKENQCDYLTECLKLKEEILKRKTKAECSIGSLVEALDKSHINEEPIQAASSLITEHDTKNAEKKEIIQASEHVHKHLLASIGKHGGVRIWSKSGKQIGSCAVSHVNNKFQKNKSPFWPTLLWYKPDVLLLADGKNQLLQCNPLTLDCKSKLDWIAVHSLHKRGVYCIASNAPRVQSSHENSDDWHVWTTSQDRNLIQYSLSRKQKLAIHSTCGGFLYTVASCPYDAGKIAVSVGDGAVRVWETSTLAEDDTKLQEGHVTSYWQNVQGKVLVVSWHPTKENLLAYATAESRIGLIDTSGKTEKPARVLPTALRGPIYSIAWGEGPDLYACADGKLVVYNTSKPDNAPVPVPVELEGTIWSVSSVMCCPRGLVCGEDSGGVVVLAPTLPHKLRAAAIVASKMIQKVDWHPQQTSDSTEESPYKNLLAVSSREKHNKIIILEYIENEDGTAALQTWKTLTGHLMLALEVMWNPHRNAQLLSTSQDRTVRIWDVVEGVCTSIFSGHDASTNCASWCAFPQLADAVLSGGSDGCLRLWRIADHPAKAHENKQCLPINKREKKPKVQKKENILEVQSKEKTENGLQDDETQAKDIEEASNVATSLETKTKGSRKFLLPTVQRQITTCKVLAAKILLRKYLEKNSPEKLNEIEITTSTEDAFDLDFLKMFGTINEVNELLDDEMESHEQSLRWEAWMVAAIFRGHIDAMVQFASQRDALCPYLLSITPCVSFKYWKDASQLYLAQIDRLVAKGLGYKLHENKEYGGPLFRKVATLLSIHDVKGAVATLTEATLFKEAYILCRTRYLDSIADETLQQWAEHCANSGTRTMAAICYIALGNLSKAATYLGKSNDHESLLLAADLAKVTGQNMFAEHVSTKRENIMKTSENGDKTEEIMKDLPSRIEALMNDVNKENKGAVNGNGLNVTVDNNE